MHTHTCLWHTKHIHLYLFRLQHLKLELWLCITTASCNPTQHTKHYMLPTKRHLCVNVLEDSTICFSYNTWSGASAPHRIGFSCQEFGGYVNWFLRSVVLYTTIHQILQATITTSCCVADRVTIAVGDEQEHQHRQVWNGNTPCNVQNTHSRRCKIYTAA